VPSIAASADNESVQAVTGTLRVVHRDQKFGASNPQGFSGGGFSVGGAEVRVLGHRCAPACVGAGGELAPAEPGLAVPVDQPGPAATAPQVAAGVPPPSVAATPAPDLTSTSPDGAGYNSAAATSGQKPTLVLTVASAPSPMAHIVQPPTGATFFDGDPITLQATAVDADGSDLGAGVTWTSSVQGLLGTGATLTTPLSVGSHTVTASVTGNAGTQAMDRVTVTVRPPPAADTEPLVAITAPADAAVVLAGSPVTFSGTANDLEDGPLGARLVWTSDRDGTLGTGASITKALSPGPHRITAAVTDTGGLVGTATVGVTVVRIATLEVAPAADAYVDAGSPSANFGTKPLLRVNANPARVPYLRFVVAGVGSQRVVRAVLRLRQ